MPQPADQAAAANRHDQRVNLGGLGRVFRAADGRAKGHMRAVKRMQDRASFLRDNAVHFGKGGGHVVAQRDFGPHRAAAFDAQRVHRGWHGDAGADACRLRRPADRQRVIAARRGHHANLPLHRVEPAQP